MNRGSFFILFFLALFLIPASGAFATNDYLIRNYLKEYNWTAQEIQAFGSSLEKYTMPDFTKREAELIAGALNLIHGSNAAVKPDELALFSQVALDSYFKMKHLGIGNSRCFQTVMVCGMVFGNEIDKWRVDGDTTTLQNILQIRFEELIKTAVLRDSAIIQDNRLEPPRDRKAVVILPNVAG